MSSHREAPEIAKDPVADSTDLYAFVSPDKPNTVTIIANYIPLESPDGGPNFYEFGDDVLYAINIDNDGDGEADVSYQFEFNSQNTIPSTFLYNDGPIESLTSASWNRRQFYSVTRVAGRGRPEVLARNIPCPPCNIGPLSTPNYASLASAAIYGLPDGRQVFAGQRAEAFFVDLGSIFELGTLRPIAELHATFGLPVLAAMPGVNSTAAVNVHSIAIQVPISDIASGGATPTNPASASSCVGIWTTASRRKARVLESKGGAGVETGPYVQVSRLGNPLVNEVLVPLSQKDTWNAQPPKDDAQFASGVTHPELAGLLNVIYPGAFPNLAAYTKPRADLEAILLTGIPAGVVSSTFSTFTGATVADMLRLNLAIPPASTPSALGVLGGDVAGYPNGRRVADDVVSIELVAVAGATIPLVDKTFTPDKAIADVSDGVTGAGLTLLSSFPYLGTPYSGYSVTPGTATT
ncbi:MAG TPA: DUF4331 domain-containing protein [Acidimicrobiales bacterium]|jgi:Domain of unknown function (DUF4331)|nr:DUF4331 domain-containing protein [Acidimicrobiales bacterium]